MQLMRQDIINFLAYNPAVECRIVAHNGYNLFQLRGVMSITMIDGSKRPFGFKFILPKNYPMIGPISFLDEKVNPLVCDKCHYLTSDN